jgi:hypothetical protein
LDRVKELLGLKNATKIDTLEAGECNAIRHFAVHCSSGEVKATLTLLWPSSALGFFDLDVPERATEPTKARSGRTRNDRALCVSIDRLTVARLFKEMTRLIGYQAHAKPKRELILKEGRCSWSSLWVSVGLTLLG